MLCEGEPLPLPYTPQQDRFEPVTVNPHQLEMTWQQTLPLGFEALAISGDDHYVYILCHDGIGNQIIVSRARSQQNDAPFFQYEF